MVEKAERDMQNSFPPSSLWMSFCDIISDLWEEKRLLFMREFFFLVTGFLFLSLSTNADDVFNMKSINSDYITCECKLSLLIFTP